MRARSARRLVLLAALALGGVHVCDASAASEFRPAQKLSAGENDGQVPQVAIADDGTAVVAWLYHDPVTNRDRVQVATRGPGQNFAVPSTPAETAGTYVSSAARNARPWIRLKMNRRGDAVVVWEADDNFVYSAYKPYDGSFGVEQLVTPGRASASPDVGIDGRGVATAVFRSATQSGGGASSVSTSSIIQSTIRTAGERGAWGSGRQVVAHPFGFGTNEIPTLYAETDPAIGVDEAGNRRVVFASRNPADNPGSDDLYYVYRAGWSTLDTNWQAAPPTRYSTTAPGNLQAVLRDGGAPGGSLLGWSVVDGANATLYAVNQNVFVEDGVEKVNNDQLFRGGRRTAAFAIDSSNNGLALWSTGVALKSHYSQPGSGFSAPAEGNPVVEEERNATRPWLATDGAGTAIGVFQRRGILDGLETVQAAIRPAEHGAKFDGPATVRLADGSTRTGAPAAVSEPCDTAADDPCDLEADTATKLNTGPRVAMNARGEGVVVWAQADALEGGDGNLRVYASLYLPLSDTPGSDPGAGTVVVPPLPPPPPKPAAPSAIELARPIKRGQAVVLTLRSAGASATTSPGAADTATRLRWRFGSADEPDIVVERQGGRLDRSIRLRLPDRSFTATVTAEGPGGTQTFSRSFTTPALSEKGDDGKAARGLRSRKTPPVFATGSAAALTGQGGCAPTQIFTGKQKLSGCFKPIEALGGVPASETGAIRALADRVRLKETDTGAMSAAFKLSDGYATADTALLNDRFPVDPGTGSSLVVLPQADALIARKASLPVAGTDFAPKGGFNLKLDPRKEDIPLGVVPKPANLPKPGGLPITGDWNVNLQRSNARVRAKVALPSVITRGGLPVNVDVELRATPDRVIVDRASLGPLDADVGALSVKGFRIAYDGAQDQWDGQGKACLVGKVCLDMAPPNGHVTLKGGRLAFAGATLQFPGPGIPLFPAVNMNRIGFGIGTGPTRMFGNVGVTAVEVVQIDGRVVIAFPTSQTPFVLDRREVGDDFPADLYGIPITRTAIGVTGRVGLRIPETDLSFQLAKAHLLYEQPGFIDVGGGFDVNLIEIIQIRGGVRGSLDIERALYNFHGDLHACLFDSDDICGGAVANVSHGPDRQGGAGACIDVGPVSVGGGVQWRRLDDPFIWPLDGCRWSPFRIVVRPSSAAVPHGGTAGYPMEVKAGEPAPLLKLYGREAAPGIRVTGPGGQTLDAPADKELSYTPDGNIRVLRFKGNEYAKPFTVVGLQDARPGRYVVQPLPGSAVTGLARATDQPAAKVSGRVSGKGGNRVLEYVVRRREAQRVVFREVQPGGAAREIGVVDGGGRGRLRFHPAPGGGTRRVEAQFELSGIPAERKTIASFRPPSIMLRAPRRIRVKRGAKVRVSWRGVKGARRYQVVLRTSGGGTVFAATRRRRATLAVPAWQSGRAYVRAVDSMRQSRPAAGGRFRARRKPPTAFRALTRCKVTKKKIRCGRATSKPKKRKARR